MHVNGRKIRDRVDVNECGGAPQAHVEHGHEALAAGENPRAAAVVIEVADGFLNRGRAMIQKVGRFQGFSGAAEGFVTRTPESRVSTCATGDLGAVTSAVCSRRLQTVSGRTCRTHTSPR